MIIRDSIYTYIEIDKEIKSIIDTESFQRLKNIKQLTIQHLYPSANHTRFEHSLGVMHLALQVFDKIKPSLLKNIHYKTDENITYLKEHLRYSSLLHDVGHAPLSHVGEKFYNRDEILAKIRGEVDFSVDFLEEKEEKIPKHEIMSCYIIIKKFKDKLVHCNFEFIFRIICGKPYKEIDDINLDIQNRNNRNIIISIVNSETIDVDKIDYLLRDNKMVGYIGPQLDVNRLLMSMEVNENKLTFTQMGISAIQGLIDCRDSLYLWIFNHHKVVYTDYLYQEFFNYFNEIFGENQQTNEERPFWELFTCRAIAEGNVSDIDALYAIKRAIKIVEHKTEFPLYIKNLVNQIQNRNHLKPLWKTLSQYNDFVEGCGYKKSTRPDEKGKLADYIENIENRNELVKKITDELGIESGKLLIITRENKFCEKILDNLEIDHFRSTKAIYELLPRRNYNEKYEKTAFYVYCDCTDDNEQKEKVRNKLTEELKKLKHSICPDKSQNTHEADYAQMNIAVQELRYEQEDNNQLNLGLFSEENIL